MFVCLCVCLYVQGLMAKLLDESPLKYAWTTSWTPWMKLKNYFWGARVVCFLEKWKKIKNVPLLLETKSIFYKFEFKPFYFNIEGKWVEVQWRAMTWDDVGCATPHLFFCAECNFLKNRWGGASSPYWKRHAIFFMRWIPRRVNPLPNSLLETQRLFKKFLKGGSCARHTGFRVTAGVFCCRAWPGHKRLLSEKLRSQ